MTRQPAKIDDKENHFRLERWPDYPSGSGYILSSDVSEFLSKANISALPAYEFEDRGVGLLLEGKAHLEPAPTFVDLHLLNGNRKLWQMSHDKLVKRRFQRILKGEKDMCGEGFQPSEVCVTAEHGKVATFECSEGFFASVAFASYGRVNKYIGPRYPWCAEGPSGFEPDEDVCVVDNRTVVAVLMKACQNKNKCEINVNLNTFGGHLPCADSARGWERPHLVATLLCS
eukprot:gene15547-16289_t